MPVLSYSLRSHGQGAAQFADLADKLATGQITTKAARAALNETGKNARKAVKSALQQQMGLSWKDIVYYGEFKSFPASAQHLDYRMVSKGTPVPLKRFGAKQDASGVQVKFGGQPTRFPGMFIFEGHWRSKAPIDRGHVFRRTSEASLPIEKQFGPSVPEEIVKGQTADAFNREADRLPEEFAKQIRRASGGTVT